MRVDIVKYLDCALAQITLQVVCASRLNSISLQDKNFELALTLYADHRIYIYKLNVKNSDF